MFSYNLLLLLLFSVLVVSLGRYLLRKSIPLGNDKEYNNIVLFTGYFIYNSLYHEDYCILASWLKVSSFKSLWGFSLVILLYHVYEVNWKISLQFYCS